MRLTLKPALLCLLLAIASDGFGQHGQIPLNEAYAASLELGTIVWTDRGLVRGVQQGSIVSFKGIPYAKPPVGNLRWTAPQLADAWPGIRDASSFGFRCTQLQSLADSTPTGREDCLTINVWTGAASSQAGLPVFVYIHGGANLLGGSDWYDFAKLAQVGPSVIVSMNYRVGPFGFLAHPALAAQDPNGSTGNYGVLDQIEALKWVQRNISRFGGDPQRVLLGGQSAGAHDTLVLIASPLARGLFSAAFSMSHSWVVQPPVTVQNTARVFERFVECEGAADMAACLRSKTPELVVKAPGNGTAGLAFDPSCSAASGIGCRFNLASVDGYVLPDTPQRIVQAGQHNAVPVIHSSTALELTQAVHANDLQEIIVNDAAYLYVLQLQWPQQVADAIFRLYPSSAYQNSPLLAYIVAMGDIDFQCPKRNMLNIMSQAQLAPVWSALWTHVWDHGEPKKQPAGHATDIPFWLRTYAAADLTTNETILSNFMAGTLIKFAYTHDPRSAYIPWPAYQAADYAYFKWGTPSKAEMGTDLREQQCTSLEQIGFNWEYFKTVH